MMGIYGTVLPVFAEQMETYSYFNMSPAIDDGYSNITSVSGVRGILRLYSAPPTAEGQKIRMAEGNLVEQKTPFFWCETVLNLGWFLADQPIINGGLVVASATNVYRIMTNNLFDNTGTLVVHGLNKLVGSNGLVASSLNYDFGTGSFI
jgi:hypothetical protein